MIPDRKKTPEEIASLREGLGITSALSSAASQPEIPQSIQSPKPLVPPPAEPIQHKTEQSEDTIQHRTRAIPAAAASSEKPTPVVHSLRKHELPLAPASESTQKTILPTHRRNGKELAGLQRREALSRIDQPSLDPVIQLQKITAHTALLVCSYLLSATAMFFSIRKVHFITPLTILGICLFLTLYIFIRKKRSRHHAAILCIIILMTLAFGGLHYAQLLNYGP